MRRKNPFGRANKKTTFVYQTNVVFLSDAFLAERDAHFVRDVDLRSVMHAVTRVGGTHRITYHSEAASLITYLQNT